MVTRIYSTLVQSKQMKNREIVCFISVVVCVKGAIKVINTSKKLKLGEILHVLLGSKRNV